MILSVCPNPSVDTYWNLHGPLHPGKTHRIGSEQRFPGGKGVHVALAVTELQGKEAVLARGVGGERNVDGFHRGVVYKEVQDMTNQKVPVAQKVTGTSVTKAHRTRYC